MLRSDRTDDSDTLRQGAATVRITQDGEVTFFVRRQLAESHTPSK